MTTISSTSKADSARAEDDQGWHASLELEIRHKGQRSVVSRSRQNGPLTIQAPFYPENEVCHLYLLHPPAGIVGGDRLTLSVVTRDRGAALITTPGATKFYRTSGKPALQQQVFRVLTGTTLEWLPQETIYFPETHGRLFTAIYLERGARFMGWDIHCLGLPANNEDFGRGQARVKLSLFREERPLLLESLTISPDTTGYSAAFLQNKPVFGSFIATGANQDLLELLRRELTDRDEDCWAATLLDDVLVVRYLGASASQARALFVASWKRLRPHILSRPAVLPRIWAT